MLTAISFSVNAVIPIQALGFECCRNRKLLAANVGFQRPPAPTRSAFPHHASSLPRMLDGSFHIVNYISTSKSVGSIRGALMEKCIIKIDDCPPWYFQWNRLLFHFVSHCRPMANRQPFCDLGIVMINYPFLVAARNYP